MTYTGFGYITGTIRCPICSQDVQLTSGTDNAVLLGCGHTLIPVPLPETCIGSRPMKDVKIDDTTQLEGKLIKSVGYDFRHHILEVEFQPPQQGNSATEKRQYESFPEYDFTEFVEAIDPDVFFNVHVQGKYPMTRP